MGKQSARLYYRGKDHKDIYFQEKYHNAMVVCKEGDEKLVWRKLYDEGYFVYTRWTYGISSYSYYTAILYPKHRIRNYDGDYAQLTYHSDKYLARKYAYMRTGARISADGKLWKSINGNNKEYMVVPKGDGIVIYSEAGYEKYKYTYVPIKNGDIDEDSALEIYSEKRKNSTTGRIGNTVGITDFCLLLNAENYPTISALAVDMHGNVYNELFATRQDSEIGGSGCYNGMYYCVFTNLSGGCYVYVSKSIGGTWERREFPVKAADVYTIQSDDGIVVYIGRVNNNIRSTVQIYTTTDFINYTRIDIPSNLIVPIINPTDETIYINYRLAYSAPEIDNANNSKVYELIYSFIGEMSMNKICYIEKGKISAPKGMIIQHNKSLRQITVYLDNLFFQESEGNFAFYEDLYPETYMSDYLEKEGD